jgi:hypothetical protein
VRPSGVVNNFNLEAAFGWPPTVFHKENQATQLRDIANAAEQAQLDPAELTVADYTGRMMGERTCFGLRIDIIGDGSPFPGQTREKAKDGAPRQNGGAQVEEL